MAKIGYEFDTEPLPPEPGDWGRRFRFVAIFLLISALTCGVIYWLVPESSRTPATPPVEAVEAGAAPGEAVEEDLPDSEPVNVSVPGGEGAVTPLPIEVSGGAEPEAAEELPVEEPTGEPGGESEGDEVPVPSGDEVREEPTATPQKGKPWVGDPVVDLPIRPEARQQFDPASAVSRIRELLERGAYREAYLAAEQLAAETRLTENSEAWLEAFSAVTAANLAVLRHGVPLEKATVSVVTQAGDSFSRLASKYHTTMQTIKTANRMPPASDVLPVNRRLVIYPGPWRIRVEKGARLLKLYNLNPAFPSERLFAVFDVGVGRLGRTPSAEFVISAKIAKPDWYTPEGRLIKYGDPENMLGEYFLKLAPAGTPDRPLLGYGIHGTPDESTVTKSLSNGCIRMRAGDIETLYQMIPHRTPVEIVD